MSDLEHHHRDLLERRRHAMNLVGPGDVGVHFEDSRLALQWLSPTGRWADLGSGAGFPGLVLAAMFPELTVDLVESRRKRCVFLQQVLLEAEVEPERVRVCSQRAETLEPGVYDGVVARAFAAPAEVLRHAQRLLRPGGVVVLFLQEDGAVPEAGAFEVFHVEHYRVQNKARKAVGLRWRGPA
jgi:16S rRNA (guanine527-N7)-methyltransferase